MSNRPRQPPSQPSVQPHANVAAPSKDRSGQIALAVASIALAGQIVTGLLQWQANQRASDIRMVEIGVSVLKAPVSDDIANIREWALDVVADGSGRPFTSPQRAALLKKPFPSIDAWVKTGSLIDYAPKPCEAFRKNADGSWTQTEKIVTPGNNVFEGNSFKGTGEARMLDMLCGGKKP